MMGPKPCILFDFVLQVSYILSGPRLTVLYLVHNPNASQVLNYNIGVIQLLMSAKMIRDESMGYTLASNHKIAMLFIFARPS